MAEFRFWKVASDLVWYCPDSDKKYFYLSRDKAIKRAKEVALAQRVSLTENVARKVNKKLGCHSKPNCFVEFEFEKPFVTLVQQGETAIVTANYPVFVFEVLRERVLICPEIKEEGKPYQAGKYEDRVARKALGQLFYVAGTQYSGEVDGVAFGTPPNDTYRRYGEYYEQRIVHVTEEVLVTEDEPNEG